MAEPNLIEEYHISVFITAGLPAKALAAIRRALDDPAFHVRLLRAVRRAFRREANLNEAKVRLSR